MKVIDSLAGTSDAPGAQIDWMPYSLPVPKGATPVFVGNAQVYLNVAPDTTIVVRGTSTGVQTFMYLSGPKAASAYSFTFKLLPKTKLQKRSNGSVEMVDLSNGRTVPALGKPWARSVQGGKSRPTSFTIKKGTVTQTIDLREATFPLVADPDFDDPLTQLIEGRVPVITEAKSATKDGPSHNFKYGRYYAGPNGLEIRLNNRGTLLAIHDAIAGAQVADLGAITLAALKNADKRIAVILIALEGVGGIAANHANDIFDNDVMKDKCFGITVPKPSLDGFLMLVTAVASGPNPANFIRGLSDVRIWLERCSPASSGVKADKPNPPAPPATRNTDTTPETPAQTVPQPTGRSTPVKPAPVDYDVDMDAACRTYYGSGTRSKYQDWNDPYSWVCVDGSGAVLGGLDLDSYCDQTRPGSRAVILENTAYGWRCRK